MEYEQFADGESRRIRRALVACYGVEIGNEAADEAMAVAWERWPRIAAMANPAGYVFRIGQSKARPYVRWRERRQLFPTQEVGTPAEDVSGLVDLFQALERLDADQRTAVMLVKSFGYTHREVAQLLDVSESVVNNLVHRGVLKLRSLMGVHV